MHCNPHSPERGCHLPQPPHAFSLDCCQLPPLEASTTFQAKTRSSKQEQIKIASTSLHPTQLTNQLTTPPHRARNLLLLHYSCNSATFPNFRKTPSSHKSLQRTPTYESFEEEGEKRRRGRKKALFAKKKDKCSKDKSSSSRNRDTGLNLARLRHSKSLREGDQGLHKGPIQSWTGTRRGCGDARRERWRYGPSIRHTLEELPFLWTPEAGPGMTTPPGPG